MIYISTLSPQSIGLLDIANACHASLSNDQRSSAHLFSHGCVNLGPAMVHCILGHDATHGYTNYIETTLERPALT